MNNNNLISLLQSIKSGNLNHEENIRKELMNISKKIDVDKVLYPEYESDWKNPIYGEKLDFKGWIQVLSLLSDISEREDEIEYRYKLFNTVLKGIDVVRENPKFDICESEIDKIFNKVIEMLHEGDFN